MYSVAATLWHSVKQYRRRHRGRDLPTSFSVFLVLALTAFLVTNGIRNEHRWINKAVNEGKIPPPAAVDQAPVVPPVETSHFHPGVLASLRKRFDIDMLGPIQAARGLYERHPARHVPHEEKATDRLFHTFLARNHSASRPLYGKPFASRTGQQLESTNAWDNFKVLIYREGDIWWTAQWFMGYGTFLLFAAIETANRDFPVSPFPALAVIGCLLSLASSQSLLFAFLVIVPRARGRQWAPKRWIAALLMFVQAESVFDCVRLYHTEWWKSFTPPWDTVNFSISQGLAYFGVAGILICIMVGHCGIQEKTRLISWSTGK